MSICAWFLIPIIGIFGCGGNVFDCEAGSHRSGDGCVENRVIGLADTGEPGDTGA